MEIRTILVPSDFSEYSEKAFSWAVAMAEKWRSRLLLLHVVPRPSYPPMVLETFNIADFEASLREEAEAHAKEFVGKSQCDSVEVETQTLVGEPFADICQ